MQVQMGQALFFVALVGLRVMSMLVAHACFGTDPKECFIPAIKVLNLVQ